MGTIFFGGLKLVDALVDLVVILSLIMEALFVLDLSEAGQAKIRPFLSFSCASKLHIVLLIHMRLNYVHTVSDSSHRKRSRLLTIDGLRLRLRLHLQSVHVTKGFCVSVVVCSSHLVDALLVRHVFTGQNDERKISGGSEILYQKKG